MFIGHFIRVLIGHFIGVLIGHNISFWWASYKYALARLRWASLPAP